MPQAGVLSDIRDIGQPIIMQKRRLKYSRLAELVDLVDAPDYVDSVGLFWPGRFGSFGPLV